MHNKTMLGVAVILAGCSAAPEGGAPGTTSEATAAPTATPHGRVVSTFQGSFDAASGTFDIAYASPTAGLTPDIAIPASGSGPKSTEGASGVVMHTSGAVALGGACGANNFCGPVEAINHFAYAATFYSYVDLIVGTGITSNGPWAYTNIASGATSAPQSWSFVDTSGASFSFSGHVEVVFASCKLLHAAMPSLGNGLYEINAGGTTIQAYCDMVFDDGQGGGAGGWTLVEDTESGAVPGAGLAQGTPQPGTAAYMNQTSWEALAALSTQVHFRSPASPPVSYVTSKIGVSGPINNFAVGRIANYGGGGTDDTNWIGTMNSTAPGGAHNRLDTYCANSVATFPSVYWACGNDHGFHVENYDKVSRWSFSNSFDAIDTYVR